MRQVSELFRLGLRSVLRHKGRSMASVVALLVGVAAVVFLQGFVNGFLRTLAEDTVFARTGAIQIHRKGHVDTEEDPLRFDLADDPQLIAKLGNIPGVRAVTRRIAFEGMLSNGSESGMFIATAIDPIAEYKVCPKRKQKIVAGSTPLGLAQPTGIVLGGAFAEGLGAKPGAPLIMSAATQAGLTNALDVTLHALLSPGLVTESKSAVVMPLGLAQNLLRMPNRVTEYALDVDRLDEVEVVSKRIHAHIGDGYEINTWLDIQQIRDFTERTAIVMTIIEIVLALLALSGVFNSVSMAVYERFREIGTMLALGVRRRQILLLFVIEAALLGVIGAVLGAGVGLALIWKLASGILLPGSGGETGLLVIPFVSTRFVLATMLGAVVGSICAAFYPAKRASNLSPLDALCAL